MRLTLPLLLLLATTPVLAQEHTTESANEDQETVAASDDPTATESTPSKVPLEQIRRYVAVFNAVKEAYVEPVDDKKLMQSAIRGLLLDLDPHSTYFDKDDAEAFDEQASGAYDGIGVELLTQPDNTLRVVAPIDGGPAARAGIKSGDVIVAVDGKPLPNNNSMAPLRGKNGSKVSLTLQRENSKQPFDITLTRETIHITSVRSRLLEPGYGYIRISAFQSDTGAAFQQQLDALQAKGALKGLVLDLRSNPGGLLNAAVQIADDLLETGVIVTTRGRIAISDSKFDATPGDRMHGKPMIVLVDAGSASAAEVLAGALRDNHRARVVGSRTFGKGSVQTVLPLDNGDSVKLTTARYYTPSGESIQASGIVPDVVFKAPVSDKPASLSDYSEATLPGHLHGDNEATSGYQPGDVLEGDSYISSALKELKQPGSYAQSQAAQDNKSAKHPVRANTTKQSTPQVAPLGP